MTAAVRSGQERVGAEGLIPSRFVGRGVTLGSSPRGWRHWGTLSLLVRSDEVGHSGFPEQEGKLCTVPHRVKDDRGAASCSPVWTGVSEQWAGDTDVGTKGISNNNKPCLPKAKGSAFIRKTSKKQDVRCKLSTARTLKVAHLKYKHESERFWAPKFHLDTTTKFPLLQDRLEIQHLRQKNSLAKFLFIPKGRRRENQAFRSSLLV